MHDEGGILFVVPALLSFVGVLVGATMVCLTVVVKSNRFYKIGVVLLRVSFPVLVILSLLYYFIYIRG